MNFLKNIFNKKQKPFMGFWSELQKTIVVLAPMADVTDAPFREVISKYGKPDVLWTEFVSCDGLFRGGYDSLIHDLKFTEDEHPIVAQFFTSKPEYMEKAARLALDMGFDGVDINMGCPDRSIEKQGCGCAMIKNPKNARAIIRAAMKGAQHGDKRIPVTVKTRLGYNKDELETWLPELLAENPAVVTIHARTRKEMSKVPANWGRIKRAVEIRDNLKSETLIFGNGDINTPEQAFDISKETNADGVMIGRGIFGKPWLFADLRERKEAFLKGESFDVKELSLEQRLRIAIEHTRSFEKHLSFKNFAIMKKHFKAYITDFPKAAELRNRLFTANDGDEIEKVIEHFIETGEVMVEK
jgi:tRNA-dihydrouridine synthase B